MSRAISFAKPGNVLNAWEWARRWCWHYCGEWVVGGRWVCKRCGFLGITDPEGSPTIIPSASLGGSEAAKRSDKVEAIMPNNCPVIERTADGRSVGRCFHWLGDDGRCERHGDVTLYRERHQRTGRLIDENDLRRDRGQEPFSADLASRL